MHTLSQNSVSFEEMNIQASAVPQIFQVPVEESSANNER